MRLRRALAIFMVAGVGFAAGSPNAAATHHRCSFKHAHTAMTDAAGRVFYFRDPDSPGDRYYGGCLYRKGLALYLAHDGFDVEGASDVVQLPALAGPYFALADGLVGDTAHTFDVEVFDLRHTRRLSASDAPPVGRFREKAVRTFHAHAIAGAGPATHDDVSAIVLSKSGAVAWVGQNLDNGNLEVHAAAAGHNQLLDSGSDIDPRSLTLSGTTLSWTRGGVPRTATLG